MPGIRETRRLPYSAEQMFDLVADVGRYGEFLPWVIATRVRLAAEADFAMAFYNPRSRSRPEGFVRLLDLLRAHCEPGRLLVFARAVSTPDEQLTVCTLAEATPEMADMRTVVLVGNSTTRRVGRFTYTPRFYGTAGSTP